MVRAVAPSDITAIVNVGRRRRAPRAPHQPRPRHDHLHGRRAPSILIAGWGLAGETWHAMDALAPLSRRGHVVQPGRPRPRHPPLPHRSAAGRGDPVDGEPGDRGRVGDRPAAAAGDRRSGADAGDGRRRGRDRVPGVLRAAPPRRAGRPRCASTGPTPLDPPPVCSRPSPPPTRVVVAPSNPIVSIDPVLAVPGVRAAVAARRARHGGGVADHRRRRAQGPGRPPAARAGPRGLGGRAWRASTLRSWPRW